MLCFNARGLNALRCLSPVAITDNELVRIVSGKIYPPVRLAGCPVGSALKSRSCRLSVWRAQPGPEQTGSQSEGRDGGRHVHAPWLCGFFLLFSTSLTIAPTVLCREKWASTLTCKTGLSHLFIGSESRVYQMQTTPIFIQAAVQ